MATKKKQQKSAIDPTTGKRQQGTVERELPIKLSEAEIAKFGKKQAQAELKRDRLVDEKSAFNSAQGLKIKEVSEEITKLATAIEAGEEMRLIKCRWEDNPTTKQRWLVRIDTGAEVPDTRRAMTTDELQQSLLD